MTSRPIVEALTNRDGKGEDKARSGSGTLGEPREVGKGGGPALKNQCNREWKFCAGIVQKKIQHFHDTARIIYGLASPDG